MRKVSESGTPTCHGASRGFGNGAMSIEVGGSTGVATSCDDAITAYLSCRRGRFLIKWLSVGALAAPASHGAVGRSAWLHRCTSMPAPARASAHACTLAALASPGSRSAASPLANSSVALYLCLSCLSSEVRAEWRARIEVVGAAARCAFSSSTNAQSTPELPSLCEARRRPSWSSTRRSLPPVYHTREEEGRSSACKGRVRVVVPARSRHGPTESAATPGSARSESREKSRGIFPLSQSLSLSSPSLSFLLPPPLSLVSLSLNLTLSPSLSISPRSLTDDYVNKVSQSLLP
eukprot:scaffold76001_cov30-Tisochrysis_lutea.AAC.2